MDDLHRRSQPRLLTAAQYKEARRKQYRRRRIGALMVLLALIGLAYYGGRSLVGWYRAWQADPATEPAGAQVKVPQADPPFVAEYALTTPDLNGDGEAERVAISQAVDGKRTIALLSGDKQALIGQALSVTDGPIILQDLPRAKHVLVWEGHLPKRGEEQSIAVGTGQAVVAAGGEPVRQAWRLDPALGFVPVDYYALVAPVTPPEPTVIVVDKGLNVLWYYENGQLVQTARVATGLHLTGPVPTAANRMANYLTPEGHFSVSVTIPGVAYWKEGIPAGDERNPLGTRWIGFQAYPGDTGLVWALHGTNDPSRLGQWVTKGTIEMRNEEIEALYERVHTGTPILIQKTEPNGG